MLTIALKHVQPWTLTSWQPALRMKDFFDIYRILVTNRVDSERLADAIKSTFANRGTSYRENHPLFTEAFFATKERQSYWNAFLRKLKYKEPIDFQTVGLLIKERLSPYWESMKEASW